MDEQINHIKYPKTGQFRDAIKQVRSAADYHGVLLMPGSHAYDLCHSKEKDHLKHLERGTSCDASLRN